MTNAAAVPLGIEAEGVTRWFADHIDAAVPPLQFERVAGDTRA